MKDYVAILSLPLKSNYGGLLQAYALNKVISNMGKRVVNLNRIGRGNGLIKYYTKKYFVKKIGKILFPQNSDMFISKYVNKSIDLFSTSELENYCCGKFEAIVVGSDQCWRPKYLPCVDDYFLKFLKNDQKVKKVSYAASFGVENIEYSDKELESCRQLIGRFDAVSVRENSAVEMCKEFFSFNEAVHVLDPTMLLEKNNYLELLDTSQIRSGVFIYVLDFNKDKKKIIGNVKSYLGKRSFEMKPKYLSRKLYSIFANSVIAPSVEKWIKSFRDAEFIVTDSFHGCVFSIIFNKPFLAIANKNRGQSRFTSLLHMFGLEDRLINNLDEFHESMIDKKIDWKSVNLILSQQRAMSIKYLNDSLLGRSSKANHLKGSV